MIDGRRCWLALCLSAMHSAAWPQTVVRQAGDLDIDVSARNGELVMDLHGGLWTVPAGGGEARQLLDITAAAERPRWSPNGDQILYLKREPDAGRLVLVDSASLESQAIKGTRGARHAAWHPGGERIVFAAPTADTGIDLFETDLRSGLTWRLSDGAGDETEPAWSESGRDLTYIAQSNEIWSLMLRRFGRQDIELVRSESELAAPAWRPDGTLITFLQRAGSEVVLQMAILSEPPLIRTLADGENFGRSPLRWVDRRRFLYVADGQIRVRRFDGRRPRTLEFRATVEAPPAREAIVIATRELPAAEPVTGRLVVRAGRVFDGLSRGYRDNVDVLIENGAVAEVGPPRDWGDAPIIELPSTTLLPGYIDAYSSLPQGSPAVVGAELLSWGITTVVSSDYDESLAVLWGTGEQPGPRLLPAHELRLDDAQVEIADEAYLLTIDGNLSSRAEEGRSAVDAWRQQGRPVMTNSWAASAKLGTNVLLGAENVAGLLAPPLDDLRMRDVGSLILVSGLADSNTPGMNGLFDARQTRPGHSARAAGIRRIAALPNLRGRSAAIVAGSLPSGLAPGLALHAELRALAAAGLDGDQVLAATGVNAARLLGLGGQIGEISRGSRADLILIDGDPLAAAGDSQRIVGVIRGGRFFSLGNLMDRRTPIVE